MSRSQPDQLQLLERADARAECEICGAGSTELGAPPGYSPAFLRCCPACQAASPRERVAAWGAKVGRQFASRRR